MKRQAGDVHPLEYNWKEQFDVHGIGYIKFDAGKVRGLAQYAEELEARVAELEADIWRVRDAYNELIMAVGMKFPDESRHQTALRYIQHRESGGSAQCAALAGKEGE